MLVQSTLDRYQAHDMMLLYRRAYEGFDIEVIKAVDGAVTLRWLNAMQEWAARRSIEAE